ncbi:hypothetical protein QD357_30910 [Rhizobium sp. BR 317]|uniref:hypothetical protein n=1 Tax=Rhizobium sp. BR 317 TaxID=3040015 RepID=UPI0039BED3FB
MNKQQLDDKVNGYSHVLEYAVQELPALGFHLMSISIFDHWLSVEEADCSTILSFSIAKKTGNLEAYLSGEKKYLSFYRSLSRCGVICGRPGNLSIFETYSNKLESILVDSLREQQLADVYFIGPEVRLIGGYDRTDTIAATTTDALSYVRREANASGLHVL